MCKSCRKGLQFYLNQSQRTVKVNYEIFIKKHPDGKILKQDFSHELRSVIPYANCLKLEKLVFEVFDKNHDGFIGKSIF